MAIDRLELKLANVTNNVRACLYLYVQQEQEQEQDVVRTRMTSRHENNSICTPACLLACVTLPLLTNARFLCERA